tara:strand:- start:819 stop:1046 length:228 start_codon:yes stop_codon:yes gene_type:complete
VVPALNKAVGTQECRLGNAQKRKMPKGGGATSMPGQGNGGGWPSTTGNKSGGGRSNNTGPSGPSGGHPAGQGGKK